MDTIKRSKYTNIFIGYALSQIFQFVGLVSEIYSPLSPSLPLKQLNLFNSLVSYFHSYFQSTSSISETVVNILDILISVDCPASPLLFYLKPTASTCDSDSNFPFSHSTCSKNTILGSSFSSLHRLWCTLINYINALKCFVSFSIYNGKLIDCQMPVLYWRDFAANKIIRKN